MKNEVPKHLEDAFWRNECCYIVFDTETTNLVRDDKTGEVNEDFAMIQIYAIKYRRNQKVDTYATLVNPGFEISEKITELTGITNEDVKDAPSFKEIVPEMLNFFLDADFIVAWNARFDLDVLQVELDRRDLPVLELPYIDPLTFERERAGRMYGNSLSKVAKKYGVHRMSKVQHGHGSLHDAQVDTEVLADIFKEIGETLPMTLGRVIELQNIMEAQHDAYYAKKRK